MDAVYEWPGFSPPSKVNPAVQTGNLGWNRPFYCYTKRSKVAGRCFVNYGSSV